MNTESFSQAFQDYFVISMLHLKRKGTYLEIGGKHPIEDNNTYLLESKFDWSGVSLEWNGNYANLWETTRKNDCICADATLVNYDELLQKKFNDTHIDYLQLDIDPSPNTLKALLKINFFKYDFSVITYEHDAYSGGIFEREASRRILESHGYIRVISDVLYKGSSFEDWYVNPNYISEVIWKQFAGSNVNLTSLNLDPKYFNLFNSFGLYIPNQPI
jgi:hypothetical protein